MWPNGSRLCVVRYLPALFIKILLKIIKKHYIWKHSETRITYGPMLCPVVYFLFVFQVFEIADNNNHGSIIIFINEWDVIHVPIFLLLIKYKIANANPKKVVERNEPIKNCLSLPKNPQTIWANPNATPDIIIWITKPYPCPINKSINQRRKTTSIKDICNFKKSIFSHSNVMFQLIISILKCALCEAFYFFFKKSPSIIITFTPFSVCERCELKSSETT